MFKLGTIEYIHFLPFKLDTVVVLINISPHRRREYQKYRPCNIGQFDFRLYKIYTLENR